jgi:hypothetical protein
MLMARARLSPEDVLVLARPERGGLRGHQIAGCSNAA